MLRSLSAGQEQRHRMQRTPVDAGEKETVGLGHAHTTTCSTESGGCSEHRALSSVRCGDLEGMHGGERAGEGG